MELAELLLKLDKFVICVLFITCICFVFVKIKQIEIKKIGKSAIAKTWYLPDNLILTLISKLGTIGERF